MTFIVTNNFGVEYELSNNLSREELKDLLNDFYDFSSWDRREIRVTDYSQTDSNDYWHIKHDSTFGPIGKYFDNGWEIASFIGRGYTDLEHVTSAMEHLRRYGAIVNDNCGLHIHLAVPNVSEIQVGIILAYWIKIEKILSDMVPDRRRNSIHCKLLRDSVFLQKNYTPIGLWQVLKPTNFAVYDNAQRRFSLNSMNYAQCLVDPFCTRTTLEFRLPEGTLSKFNVLNWFYLFQEIINRSKNLPMPTTLRSFTVKQFLDFFGFHSEPTGRASFDNFRAEFFIWFLGRLILNSKREKTIEEAKKYIQFSKVFC